MKRWVLALVLFGIPTSTFAVEGKAERVHAPYFQTDENALLPLKSSHTEVTVAGVIAHARVTQTYQNTGDVPIEAIYIFPGSTRSAVFGMRMTIGERTIEATIDKRKAARKLYEGAKEEGKSASLLEQQRPNVFQMNVANILPGDEIDVQLDYTELLVPDGNEYELVVPAVVGPRYSTETGEESAWLSNPYLKKDTPVPYEWTASVTVDAGMPIAKIACTSHDVEAKFESKERARVDLTESGEGDRDFIVRYRMAGDALATGLLLHEREGDSGEQFFLMMVQPPSRVEPEAIPPRDYTFVVDVSGSMGGFPLEVSKALMRDLLGGLRPTDTFNVMFFAGGNTVLWERSVPATPANIKQAVYAVDNQRGGGGTELLAALKRAFELSEEGEKGVSRTIVVATDGYVAVEPQSFELIRKSLGSANLFSFGIGRGVNRHLIEGMARVGHGEPFVATSEAEAKTAASRFATYIKAPALTDVAVSFDGFDAYDVEPASIPDVFASRPVLVFGKYKGRARGNITVSGVSGNEDWEHVVRVADSRPDATLTALPYLWARSRVAMLSDLNQLRADDKRVEEVTDLGLEYNLLTAYTSFVAIDEVVRSDGQVKTVKQPLPLPSGVENSAVGGGSVGYGMLGAKGRGKGGGGTAYGVGIGGSGTVGRSAVGHGSGGYIGKGKSDAHIGIGGKEVSAGTYDKNVIHAVIKRHLARIRYCYEKQLQRDPKLAGKLIIEFKIDENGNVTVARVASSTLGDPTAETCIVAEFKKLRFPAPEDGTVTVKYPMVFKAQN